MKIKPVVGSLLGLALVATMTGTPVKADEDNRRCWYDRRTDRIECLNGRNRYDRRDNRYRRVEDRVDRLYREVLGRRADRSGLRAYTNRVVRGGWSYGDVRRELARSREARTQINRLYREILGRSADRRGLISYQRRLERGWSMAQVRRDLMNSSEGRRRDRYYDYRR